MRNIKLLAAAAAIAVLPFTGGVSQAATCGVASVATYTATGFSCDYNGLTFSGMSVNTTGAVTLGNITPETLIINGVTEIGLSLNYDATAYATLTGGADVAWVYNVSTNNGQSIVDAYVNLTAQVSGTGSAGVTETLSNGVSLNVSIPPGPSSATATFDPVDNLHVTKDQFDQICDQNEDCDGRAVSSILENAFSLQGGAPPETPLPAAVWMFGSVLAGAGGVAGWRRKRKAA